MPVEHRLGIPTRALITGINGSGASYLAEVLAADPRWHVAGLARWRGTSSSSNISHIDPAPEVFECDLLDPYRVKELIDWYNPNVVFHMAAYANVRASFDVPMTVMDNNVRGTQHLLEACRSIKHRTMPLFVMCSCYDEETELLTQRGFVRYDDIRSDDLVVSINPSTKDVGYQPISEIKVYDYEGEIRRIERRGIDLMVTPNHRLLGSPGNESAPLEFRKPDELQQTVPFYSASGRHRGQTNIAIHLGSHAYDVRDVLYLMGLYIGDGHSDVHTTEKTTKSGLSREEYLREGRDPSGRFSKVTPKAKTHTTCTSRRLFLSMRPTKPAHAKALACLDRMGLSYSVYPNAIYVKGANAFVDLFDEIGHSALQKRIPEWVFDYDADVLDHLYFGMMDTDGHYAHRAHRYSTSSSALVASFTKLCLFTGRFATVSARPPCTSVIEGREVRGGVNYLFSISTFPRTIRGQDVTTERYQGKVWCLEIEGTHNFAVRRNGRTVFCGNSSEVYGDVQQEDLPITEDQPFRPVSPYAVSKAAQDLLGYQYFAAYGLPVVTTRMFAYVNPRRPDIFTSAWARQIARMERGLQEPVLLHGNLESTRVFLDVQDAMSMYVTVASRGMPGEAYNIGGSQIIRVGDVLEVLAKHTAVDFTAEESPDLMRPTDVTLQIPCTDKVVEAVGGVWNPMVTFDQSIARLMQYWRERVRREQSTNA